jgi:DNA invertase Pin-like site-specific DNA recombinase/uncharacterized protein YqgV (UPF0045/DUF77 family)
MAQAFSYIRFSSQGQASGSSLERQLIVVQDWLERNPEVKLSETSFRDLGISGQSGAHLKSAFGRLLAAIEKGYIKKGDYILVEAVDRLGRLKKMKMLVILQQIVEAGVSIITLDDEQEYNITTLDEDQGLLSSLIGKFEQAYNYSEQLKKRIKKSWDIRRIKARNQEKVNMRRAWWIDEELKLIPEYAEVMRTIFKLYLMGEGQNKILIYITIHWPELFGDGKKQRGKLVISSNKSGTINPVTIVKWIKNKVAIGYWGDIPNVFEPVVTEEEFYRAKAIRESRHKSSGPSSKYFVQGIFKCHCGNNYTFPRTNAARNNGVANYNGKCTRKSKLGEGERPICKNQNVPLQVADAVVHWCVSDAIEKIHSNKLNQQNSEQIVVLEGKRDELTEKIKAVAAALAEVGYIDEIKDQLIFLKSEREAVEASLERVRSEITSLPSNFKFDTILELEQELRKDYTAFNRLLRLVGYQVVIKGDIMTASVSDGKEYKFRYLGFNRRSKGFGSRMYQVLLLDKLYQYVPLEKQGIKDTDLSLDDLVSLNDDLLKLTPENKVGFIVNIPRDSEITIIDKLLDIERLDDVV